MATASSGFIFVRELGGSKDGAIEKAERVHNYLQEVQKMKVLKFETIPVENNYDIYDESAAAYKTMPTVKESNHGDFLSKPCYYLLVESPDIVIHFKSLPSRTLTKMIAAQARKALSK